MKSYLAAFYKDENGAELIEVALAIAIVAILAAAIFGIIKVLLIKIEQAGNMIGDIDPSAVGGSGTGAGTGGGTGAGGGGGAGGIGGVTE